MRRLGGDANGSVEDDAGPGRVTLLVKAWALPLEAAATSEEMEGNALASTATAVSDSSLSSSSSLWAARMHGVDLIQASGVRQAFVNAGLRALGNTVHRAIATNASNSKDANKLADVSAAAQDTNGNTEAEASQETSNMMAATATPWSTTLALSLALARFMRRGPSGQWPLTGLAAPSIVALGGASSSASEHTFLVQGSSGWWLKAPLPHLEAGPKLVRFLRSRSEAYAFSALTMNSSCSNRWSRHSTAPSKHKGSSRDSSSSSSSSREGQWWRVGSLPWRAFSAAARAAGEPTRQWTKVKKAAAPLCTFLVSANDSAGWSGDASLLLMLRTPSDDHGDIGEAMAQDTSIESSSGASSISRWATSAQAVQSLLEATRGHLCSVVERAASDLASVRAWQEMLRKSRGDDEAMNDLDLWAPLLGERSSEIGSSRVNSTSSAAASPVVDAVASQPNFRRRRLRVPLLALHAGLTQYTPKQGIQEEERVGSSEEEDERGHEDGEGEGQEDRTHGREVAIASSVSAGLQALLLACPIIPLSDLDERLDTLFVPPSPDSTLDGPHEARALAASFIGSGLIHSTMLSTRNNILLSPAGDLCVTWAAALEKLRTKHETTSGAQTLLFADPLPLLGDLHMPVVESTFSGLEAGSGTIDGSPEMSSTSVECHMLLLPPPPTLRIHTFSDETSPQLPDLNQSDLESKKRSSNARKDSARTSGTWSSEDSEGKVEEESILALLDAFETTANGALLLSWREPSALASKRPGAVRARVLCVSGVHASTVTLSGVPSSLSPLSSTSMIGAENPGSSSSNCTGSLEAHVQSLMASFAPHQGAASSDAQTKEALAAAEAIEVPHGSAEHEAWDADVLPEGALPGWMMGSLPCGVRRQTSRREDQQQCIVS